MVVFCWNCDYCDKWVLFSQMLISVRVLPRATVTYMWYIVMYILHFPPVVSWGLNRTPAIPACHVCLLGGSTRATFVYYRRNELFTFITSMSALECQCMFLMTIIVFTSYTIRCCCVFGAIWPMLCRCSRQSTKTKKQTFSTYIVLLFLLTLCIVLVQH